MKCRQVEGPDARLDTSYGPPAWGQTLAFAGVPINGDNFVYRRRNSFRVWTAFVLGLATVMALAVSVGANDAKLLKKSELKSLIANATTEQDHERLAQHFTAKAENLEAYAKDHEE